MGQTYEMMILFVLDSRFANKEQIMILKPQDILVLLKLVVKQQQPWAYHSLATELGMSPSEVHAAIKRALAAGLAMKISDEIIPVTGHLRELLLHGLRFVFVPDRGGMTRGMPTYYAAQPLESLMVADGEPPPVWPDPEGEIRGMAFSPLYKSVPFSARRDQKLYELLVLVDGVRGGRVREHILASEMLGQRLEQYA